MGSRSANSHAKALLQIGASDAPNCGSEHDPQTRGTSEWPDFIDLISVLAILNHTGPHAVVSRIFRTQWPLPLALAL